MRVPKSSSARSVGGRSGRKTRRALCDAASDFMASGSRVDARPRPRYDGISTPRNTPMHSSSLSPAGPPSPLACLLPSLWSSAAAGLTFPACLLLAELTSCALWLLSVRLVAALFAPPSSSHQSRGRGSEGARSRGYASTAPTTSSRSRSDTRKPKKSVSVVVVRSW
jgi:hypothetical protein